MGAIASQITSLTIVLLNHLFRRRWKKTSKLRVTGFCAGNSPGAGEFPAQMTSNAENVSISWRHHASGALVCNHTPSKVCEKLLTHPWISNFIPHFIIGVITYPCWMLVLKLIPLSNMGHWIPTRSLSSLEYILVSFTIIKVFYFHAHCRSSELHVYLLTFLQHNCCMLRVDHAESRTRLLTYSST